MSEQQTSEQNATTPNAFGNPGDDPAVADAPADTARDDYPVWANKPRPDGWENMTPDQRRDYIYAPDPTTPAGAPATPDGPAATDQAPVSGAPESRTLADDAPAQDVDAARAEPDGTVGDFGGDVAAFNNRDSDTDDDGREVATFRSATGHNDAEPDE